MAQPVEDRAWGVEQLRRRFPALQRLQGGEPLIYFDGPAGTQVPIEVADAVREGLLCCNANRHGYFETSRRVEAVCLQAQQAMADLLGAHDPECIVLGPNMTSMTFQFSRALAQSWKPGDEIVVSGLDHDANYTPWVLAARDAGVKVRSVAVRASDATLDMDDVRRQLSSRTVLMAVTAASNAVGSLTDIPRLADWVHAVGGELYVDAVHLAPHRAIDVNALDCDYLVCSAYKFFAPHVGVLWGRRQRLEELEPYKLRPAPSHLPEKWMTGTQNHAALAGVTAAVDYLASLASDASLAGLGPAPSRRQRLLAAFEWIEAYERSLVERLLRGLLQVPGCQVFGITDPQRFDWRVPTVSLRLSGWPSAALAEALAGEGIQAWSGNYYALPLTEQLGVEPDGMLRLGLMHYNTASEVDRVLEVLERLGSQASSIAIELR